MVPHQSFETPVQSKQSVAAKLSNPALQIPIRRVQTLPLASTAATGRYTQIAEDVKYLRHEYAHVMHTLAERKRALKLVAAAHTPVPRSETPIEPLRGPEASESVLVQKIQGIHPGHLPLVRVPKGVRMSRIEASDALSPRSTKKGSGQTRMVIRDTPIFHITTSEKERLQHEVEELFNKADTAVAGTEMLISRLRREFRGTLVRIKTKSRHRVIARKVDASQATVVAIHAELERFLDKMYQSRRIAYAADVLAHTTDKFDSEGRGVMEESAKLRERGHSDIASHHHEQPAPLKPLHIRYERSGLIRRKGLLRVVYEQPAPVRRGRGKSPPFAPASLRARRPTRRRGGRRIPEGVVRSVLLRFNIKKESSATQEIPRKRAGRDPGVQARREERARLRREMRKAEKERLAVTVGSWLGGGREATEQNQGSEVAGLFGQFLGKIGMGVGDVDGEFKERKERGNGGRRWR
jgi:hypothetical protein